MSVQILGGSPLTCSLRLLFVSGLFLFHCHLAGALPAFPGAAGFGSNTVGGRSGNSEIRRVTSLLDDENNPEGTLRWALTKSASNVPRYVIFEVSGIIRLSKDIKITQSYLTVFGQTAPAPGITIEGASLVVQAHDVVIQHLAVRPGRKLHLPYDTATGIIPSLPSTDRDGDGDEDPYFNPGYEMAHRDAIILNGLSKSGSRAKVEVYNVIIDHVSFSWSTDEVASSWGNGEWMHVDAGMIHDFTFSNCIFAEALYNTGHTAVDDGTGGKDEPDKAGTPESHSMGLILGTNSYRGAVLNSLMAFNEQRNPLIRSDVDRMLVVNNLVYSPGFFSGHRIAIGSKADGVNRVPVPLTVSIKGNVVVAMPLPSLQGGNAVSTKAIWVDDQAAASTTLFLKANESTLYKPAGPQDWFPTNINDQYDDKLTRLEKPDVIKAPTEPLEFTDSALHLPPLITGHVAVESHVLANAGARPAARDVVDTRIANAVASRSQAGFIDSPSDRAGPGMFTDGELAGYPAWTEYHEERKTPIDLNGDENHDGYSNLENWVYDNFSSIVEGSSPRVARSDTFSDGNANGWSPLGVHAWAATVNAYRQSDTAGDARTHLTGTSWRGDQVVEAQLTAANFNGTDRWMGVNARFQDMTHSYYVALRSSDKVELKKIDGTTVTVFDSKPFPIDLGPLYNVRLKVASGGALSATITNLSNSQSVSLSGIDPSPYRTGNAGLTTYKTDATFDNVFASPVLNDVRPPVE